MLERLLSLQHIATKCSTHVILRVGQGKKNILTRHTREPREPAPSLWCACALVLSSVLPLLSACCCVLTNTYTTLSMSVWTSHTVVYVHLVIGRGNYTCICKAPALAHARTCLIGWGNCKYSFGRCNCTRSYRLRCLYITARHPHCFLRRIAWAYKALHLAHLCVRRASSGGLYGFSWWVL